MKRDIYNIRKSTRSVGQLYPVLMDSKGNHIIDGLHRLQVDPKWMTVKLEDINNKKEILIARIIANICRREVHNTEKSQLFNELATILEEEKIPKKQITREIALLTGVSYRSVSRYLSNKFKEKKFASKAANLASYGAILLNKMTDHKDEVRKKMVIFTREKTDLVSATKTFLKAKKQINYHSHSTDMYTCCIKGGGKFITTKEYPYQPGSVIYCNKYVPHKVINLKDTVLEILSFYIPNIKLKALIKEDEAGTRQNIYLRV